MGNHQCKITRSEISLRSLRRDDVPLLLEWMHDPKVVQWFQFDFLHSTDKSVCDFIEQSNRDIDNRHFAIQNLQNEYLGTISLKNLNQRNKNAEYAIALRSCAMGKGIAGAATTMLLQKAFVEYGLEKVYLNVVSDNQRAVKFYRKYGFSYEGCFRKHVFVQGCLRDLEWYACYREVRRQG